MTKKTTELSTAKSACYCCLRETNLSERHFGGLTYHVCSDCLDARFAYNPEPYQGKLLMTFVCGCHGDRHLDYLPRFFIGLDLINNKNGTRKTGTKVRLGVDWKKEVERLREEYKR